MSLYVLARHFLGVGVVTVKFQLHLETAHWSNNTLTHLHVAGSHIHEGTEHARQLALMQSAVVMGEIIQHPHGVLDGNGRMGIEKRLPVLILRGTGQQLILYSILLTRHTFFDFILQR
jgi:hypothetical protein